MIRAGRLSYLASAISAALTAGPALADLEFNEAITESGTGIGSQLTILTIQQPGGGTTESGCVAWNGSANVIGAAACPTGFAGGNEKTGASQTLTRALGEASITDFNQLGIVLNVNQGTPVTLDDMVMRVWPSNSGTPCFTAELFDLEKGTQYLGNGTGGSGHFFTLTADQVTAANAACAAPRAAYRVGLAANMSNAKGGNETWFLANTNPPAQTQLCVKKVIASGSLDQTFGFTATGQSQFILGDQATQCFAVSPTASTTVTETVPQGWENPGISCDGGSVSGTSPSVTVTSIPNGTTVTCTFTNTETPPEESGTICVTKVVVGGSTQAFDFRIDDTDYAAEFTLQNGGKTCEDVKPNNYDVSEVVPAGWQTPAVNCGEGTSNTSSITVAVENEQTVECTFTNTPVPLPPPPKPIPTVGAFGLGALALMLVGIVRRRLR